MAGVECITLDSDDEGPQRVNIVVNNTDSRFVRCNFCVDPGWLSVDDDHVDHRLRVHASAQFYCDTCEDGERGASGFETIKEISKHVVKENGINPGDTKNMCELIRIPRKPDDLKIFRCTFCPGDGFKLIGSEEAFLAHVNNRHGLKAPKRRPDKLRRECRVCNENFGDDEKLTRHVRKCHLEEGTQNEYPFGGFGPRSTRVDQDSSYADSPEKRRYESGSENEGEGPSGSQNGKKKSSGNKRKIKEEKRKSRSSSGERPGASRKRKIKEKQRLSRSSSSERPGAVRNVNGSFQRRKIKEEKSQSRSLSSEGPGTSRKRKGKRQSRSSSSDRPGNSRKRKFKDKRQSRSSSSEGPRGREKIKGKRPGEKMRGRSSSSSASGSSQSAERGQQRKGKPANPWMNETDIFIKTLNKKKGSINAKRNHRSNTPDQDRYKRRSTPDQDRNERRSISDWDRIERRSISVKELGEHKRSGKFLSCEFCDDDRIENMQNHLSSHHHDRTFLCTLCEEAFSDINTAAHHLNRQHERNGDGKSLLKTGHIQRPTQLLSIICKFCKPESRITPKANPSDAQKWKFEVFEHMDLHEDKHKGEDEMINRGIKYSCRVCTEKVWENFETLSLHVKNHHKTTESGLVQRKDRSRSQATLEKEGSESRERNGERERRQRRKSATREEMVKSFIRDARCTADQDREREGEGRRMRTNSRDKDYKRAFRDENDVLSTKYGHDETLERGRPQSNGCKPDMDAKRSRRDSPSPQNRYNYKPTASSKGPSDGAQSRQQLQTNFADKIANKIRNKKPSQDNYLDDLDDYSDELHKQKNSPAVTMFRCKNCQITTADRFQMMKHLKNVHGIEETMGELLKNAILPEVQVAVMCKNCSKVWTEENNMLVKSLLRKHQNDVHKDIVTPLNTNFDLKCRVCSKSFPLQCIQDMDDHTRSHSKGVPMDDSKTKMNYAETTLLRNQESAINKHLYSRQMEDDREQERKLANVSITSKRSDRESRENERKTGRSPTRQRSREASGDSKRRSREIRNSGDRSRSRSHSRRSEEEFRRKEEGRRGGGSWGRSDSGRERNDRGRGRNDRGRGDYGRGRGDRGRGRGGDRGRGRGGDRGRGRGDYGRGRGDYGRDRRDDGERRTQPQEDEGPSVMMEHRDLIANLMREHQQATERAAQLEQIKKCTNLMVEEIIEEIASNAVEKANSSSETSNSPCYTPNSPSKTLDSPCYTPNSPSKTLDSPCYTPSSPSKIADSPCYTPSSPYKALDSPCYAPNSPSKTPDSPSYAPNYSSKTPDSPVYTPNSPFHTLVPQYDTPKSPSLVPQYDTPNSQSRSLSPQLDRPNSPSHSLSPPRDTPNSASPMDVSPCYKPVSPHSPSALESDHQDSFPVDKIDENQEVTSTVQEGCLTNEVTNEMPEGEKSKEELEPKLGAEEEGNAMNVEHQSTKETCEDDQPKISFEETNHSLSQNLNGSFTSETSLDSKSDLEIILGRKLSNSDGFKTYMEEHNAKVDDKQDEEKKDVSIEDCDK